MKPRTLLSTLLITPLVAQVDPDEGRGSFQSIPHFVTTIATSPAPQLPGLRWKAANDIPATIPVPLDTPNQGLPRYSLQKLFDFVPESARALLVLDGISTGNDEIPLQDGNVLDPGPEGWVAILFSVGEGATLSLNDERTNRHGDIYSTHLAGAFNVPPPLVGSTWLEQGAEHMGLPPGHGVIGHDLQMPHIQNGTGPVAGYISVTNRFFFSLTADSAEDCNDYFAPFLGLNRPLSGADILQMTWDNQANSWSNPSIFRTAEELVGHEDADVDALAVDLADLPNKNGEVPPEVIMISLAANAWLPPEMNALSAQILAQRNGNGTAQRVKDRNGVYVKLVLTGEVDSIAVLDPETATGNPYVSNANIGNQYLKPQLSLSISSNEPPTGSTYNYHFSVGNFLRNMPAGTVEIEWKLATGTTWLPLVSANRALLQRTVQFTAPFPHPSGQAFFRAKFATSTTNVAYSWPVFLKQ